MAWLRNQMRCRTSVGSAALSRRSGWGVRKMTVAFQHVGDWGSDSATTPRRCYADRCILHRLHCSADRCVYDLCRYTDRCVYGCFLRCPIANPKWTLNQPQTNSNHQRQTKTNPAPNQNKPETKPKPQINIIRCVSGHPCTGNRCVSVHVSVRGGQSVYYSVRTVYQQSVYRCIGVLVRRRTLSGPQSQRCAALTCRYSVAGTLKDVRVHFDCAGSRKIVLWRPLRAPRPFFELSSFSVSRARGTFELWNVGWRVVIFVDPM